MSEAKMPNIFLPDIISLDIAPDFDQQSVPAEIFAMQHLWKAVVLRAFQDVLSTSTKIVDLANKRRARQWLLYDRSDFYEVCQNASYDPRYIRQQARKICDNLYNSEG
jgi:hypothetical protein